MKLVNFYRKPISMLVMVTFTILLCFWANQSPAAPLAPASNKSSTASLANAEEEGPGLFEQEKSESVVKKGKKIPWLIIGAAVVIGAAAIYFLVIKKTKYTLTVNLGANCSGIPAVTAKYNKGTVVNYSYVPLAGYSNPQVKLDGVDVPSIGIVTMDKDKALTISAEPLYTLTATLGTGCTGTPAVNSTYTTGTVVNYSYTLMDGYTDLQVKLDGVDVPSTGTVTMDKDKALTVTAEPLYTLTVTLDKGCSGTPAVTTKYKRGTVVNYSYTASVRYENLQVQTSGYAIRVKVKLDGVIVPNSGTITMDKDKAFTVTTIRPK